MIIAIDASNIIMESGGYIHLKNILTKFDEKKISKLYLFSSKQIISELNIKNKKIITLTHEYLNKGLVYRIIWQIFLLNSILKKLKCSALFIPGGYFFFKKISTFILIQNLLPFIKKPKYHESISRKFKNIILDYLHTKSVKRSDGVIFLSNYSKKFFISYNVPKVVIPHGIEDQFFKKKNFFPPPKKNKLKILYLSKLEGYKNHKNIVLAIYELLKKDYIISLTLVGLEQLAKKDLKLFNLIKKINKYYPNSIILRRLEKHDYIHKIYRNYDLHVFGSMCEAFGIIILETIASSLPIVCNNFPVFKEILNEHTLYFNAQNPKNISFTIEKYIKNPTLKVRNTKKLFKISKKFKWETTSKATFNFIVNNTKKVKD